MTEEKKDIGVRGYYVPKTCNYFDKSFSFSKAKRDKSAGSKSPDPTKYNDEYKENFKKHWNKKTGFLKGKKTTFIDNCVKTGRLTPGPGQYDISLKSLSKRPLTTFGISERTSFLDQAAFLSEETPSSWNYKPKDIGKPKGKPWVKPKTQLTEKSILGPGKYADGIEKAQALTRPVSPVPIFHKSSPSKKSKNRGVPAVGSYKNLEVIYQKLKFKKDRSTIILPYKKIGFTDDDVKRAKGTPGPGAYNIGPTARSQKKPLTR